MTELIKQRLVGMLILVLAGVVFIPDLLDGQKNTIKEDFKKIPPRPESSESPTLREFPSAEVQSATEQLPQASDEVAQEDADDTAETTSVQVDALDIEEPAEEVQITQVTVDETLANTTSQFDRAAWVLRLGTFRNKPNVDALLNKLEEAGFTTFVKPVEAKAGTLYRVFVGPEFDKSKLEKAQKTLKELTGLNGKVTRFEPIN